jgi:hypothetical protein
MRQPADSPNSVNKSKTYNNMAGDWMKFEKATLEKPEVFQIAGILGIDPDAVIGKLLRVWNWFDDQSRDGHAHVTLMSRLDRDTGVTGFVTAMEKVGWMVFDGETISLPNYCRHNGETAKVRSLARTRKQNERIRHGDSVTNSGQNRDTTVTREENRREEKSDTPPVSPKGESPRKSSRGSKAEEREANITAADHEPIPLELNVPAFQDAWTDWLTYRADLYRSNPQKPWTAMAAQKTLNECAKHGTSASVAAINGTISNGWQGIVWDKFEGAPAARPATSNPAWVPPTAKEVTWEEHLRLTWDGDEEELENMIRRRNALNTKFNLSPNAA